MIYRFSKWHEIKCDVDLQHFCVIDKGLWRVLPLKYLFYFFKFNFILDETMIAEGFLILKTFPRVLETTRIKFVEPNCILIVSN